MDSDIIIYSGSKCGTQTINSTLSNYGYKILSIHNNEFFIDNFKELIKKTSCESVEQLINKIDKKIYIIDSYRLPIERSISSFFQNLNIYLGNDSIDVDLNILNYMFNMYEHVEDYHPLDIEYPILKDINQINYLSIKKVDNKIFIKLNFKNINSWGINLSEIMGFDIKLINNNMSVDKKYYKLYNEFKLNFKVTKNLIEFIKNDPIFKKYNNEIEQKEYIDHWSLKSKDNYYFIDNLLFFYYEILCIT